MNFHKILFVICFFILTNTNVYANEINIANFGQLIDANVQSGDTLSFTNDLVSDETIGNHFEGLNITINGNSHYLNGGNSFGGFVVSQNSDFNNVAIVQCKGQAYQSSVYAGAIFNNGSHTVINNAAFSQNFVDAASYYFGVAGAVYNINGGTIDINNSLFLNNSTNAASSFGGAIANGYHDSPYVARMNINNTVFNGNHSEGSVVPYGGAIYNRGEININSSLFENNYAQGGDNIFVYGGSLYNIGTMSIENTTFKGNYGQAENNSVILGGAIYNNAKLSINNSVFQGNFAKSNYYADGAAIYNDIDGNATISNSLFDDNSVKSSAQFGECGAVYNSGKITVIDSTFKNNTDKNGDLNDIYNTSTGVVEFTGSGTTNILSGINGSGLVEKNGSGILNLGGENNKYTGDFDFNEGTVHLLANSSYFRAVNSNFANNVNFNMQNGQIDNVDFGNLNLNGTTNVFADVNFNTKTMDTIAAKSLGGGGFLQVKNLALEGVPDGDFISIPFADTVLKDSVKYTSTTLHTPIYDYLTTYDSTDGNFDFIRLGFNSAILVSPVAAQLAGYLTQIDTFRNVFANLDMVMIMPPDVKAKYSLLNKSAFSDERLVYAPLLMPENKKGIWFKPYSSFENVSLKNGPRVSNVSYGSLVGVESELKKVRNGWYSLYGAYLSYNGSHQAYQGNSIYNNGGMVGLDAVFYKGKFFSAWTANVGANSSEAGTNEGIDNFAMLNTGIAQMSGFNFETFRRKIIIQPSVLTSYSFINTFNYKTASGVNINTTPLQALQVEPRVKLIGNFKNYLQPYLAVSMVWNIIDHAKFQANDVYLPNLAIKPFVQYGAGVQKRFGERITGFFETMLRNGGRNGIVLQFGLRFSI